MNRLNQALLGLLGLQVVVLLGLTFAQEDQLSVQSRSLFPELEPEQVNRVEIQGPSGDAEESVRLVRKGTDWVLEDADAYPAKGSEVDSFLDKVADLMSRTTVLNSPRYHEKLEVSADKYERKVALHTGAGTTTFYLGTSPSFKNTHLRIEGEDEVVLVNGFGTSDAGNRAWNWVDRTYVDIPKDQVWAVELTNENGNIKLERDPVSNQWALLGSTEKIKSTEVDTLVNKARSVNLETPVGTTVKPSFGLEEPTAVVKLTVGTSTIAGTLPPTTEVKTLSVGAEIENKNRRYVKSSESEYVVQVADYAVDPLLEKTKDDLLADEEE
ncbi:MAG: DUF4340 domain-containing protein [Myxococcota bacterium]